MNDVKWNFCNKTLPDSEKAETLCLVICREWDIFKGQYGNEEIRVLSFIGSSGEWNTKSDIIVIAWIELKPLFEQYIKQAYYSQLKSNARQRTI